MTATTRTVRRGPATLAVQEHGDGGDRPTVVLVHGWPDSSALWDRVVAALGERFHVVTFDQRGVGASTVVPGTRRSHAVEELGADLLAVLEAVSPDRPAHVVGHDWGSILTWDLLTRGDVVGRVASFTSVSGPSLDQLGASARERLRHPGGGNLAVALEQAVRSSYTLLLGVPGLPDVLLRRGVDRVLRRAIRSSAGFDPADPYPGPGLAADAAALVPIYRQNLVTRLRRPAPHPVEVPVQLVVNLRDVAISPKVLTDVERWAPRLVRRELAAGHWSPRSHAEELAAFVAEFVVDVEDAQVHDAAART